MEVPGFAEAKVLVSLGTTRNVLVSISPTDFQLVRSLISVPLP